MRFSITRVLMTLAMLVVALSSAAAQSYPRDVEARIESARDYCKDAAGKDADSKGVVLKPEAIRKLDLNGDGRADYLMDFGRASCDDNEAYFCGSGGCYLVILIAKPDGSFVTVYDDQVLNYGLSNGRAPYSITLNLHHGDCHDGREVCIKRGRISDKPLSLKMVRR